MAVNALFITTLTLLAMGLLLLGECTYLVPYRALIWAEYVRVVMTFAAALFVNIFAAVYLVGRAALLKDTGRKLAHLEKQLRTGGAISQELAERLDE